ncbi:PF14021 family protein [Capnocytophaga sp. oral taxon 412 str. F0487]|nr:PF14021 family protein [Capnocytophaga sp. oral taxon 412 str. F0487]
MGAVGDIGVNVSQHIDPNSLLGQVVNSYNLAMGVIGIKNLGQAGYKFTKNLPQATKNLLQKNGNLRVQLAKRYQDWKKGIEKLKTLNKEERDLLDKQEEVWRSLGFVDDFKNLIYRNVSYEDFIKTFNATDEQYKIAFKLWGEEKWDELYKFFKENRINEWNGVVWPPFNGAKSILKVERGEELAGKVFDRFQVGKDAEKLDGRFASPVLNSAEGVEDLVFTYDSRALSNPITEGTYYYKFKMKKGLPSNLEFEYAEAIPWFKLQGTADQIRSSEKFSEISGHIEIIEVLKFEKGKWKIQKLK